MTDIPVEHFETEKDGAKYVRSVFSFYVETEVKKDHTIDDVKEFNIGQIIHVMKNAVAVKR